ncbi:lactonase family protein [Olivibacter sp. SDN3]|nr:lactonase family protein [Olivibacter sp. SDN3]
MAFLIPVVIMAQENVINLLIGTYTDTGKSQGIYVYAFDTVSGKLTYRSEVPTDNPSFLTLSKDRKYVYSVNELGEGNGRVSAFAYDSSTAKLRFLNQQAALGDAPCHITIDQEDKNVIVSNYNGGNFAVFGRERDGRLTEKKQVVGHQGSGPDKSRQEKPHVHSAIFSPNGKFLLVQDLGTDQVSSYPYDVTADETPVSLAEVNRVTLTPGSGPRHAIFSKDGDYVYVVQEMKPAVTVFNCHEGQMQQVQEITMLSEDFTGDDVGAADIHISPDGKFLYASNRGDANDIAIYKVDQKSGRLSLQDHQSVGGKGPRNFVIAPEGNFLLVANQYTDNVTVFKRDFTTGLLEDTGIGVAIGAPVCLVFDR